MGLIFPFALGLLALAIPIVIFYLLKLRREELTVSSSFLWQRVIEDKQANAPWQKLQKNWLLLLQLLLLLLLVFVLGRPFFATNAKATGNIIVLLDSSASMQSTDVKPSRFAKAKEEIGSIIDGMGGGDRMTIVLMHNFPEVIATNSTNKADLHSGLDKAKVTNESVNARDALTLASASADRTPGTTVVVVSDGAFARDQGLPPLKAKVNYIKIGSSDANEAISALQLREAPSGPQLFISINNYSVAPANLNLNITVDGKPFATQAVQISPEDKAALTLANLPLTTHTVAAKITAANGTQDFLAADNEAYTVRNQGTPQKILLVTEGNSFLDKLLTRLPNYKTYTVTPAEYANLKNRDSYDLYIMDGYAPDKSPPAGMFLINPPTSPLLQVVGQTDQNKSPTIAQLDQTDPLLRYTDLSSSIAIAQAEVFTVPGWAHTVIGAADGTPLLIAGDNSGQRVVALAFDLHRSDLGLNSAWPILLLNILSYLQPAGALDQVTQVNPGDPVSYAVGQREQISITPPNGTAQLLKSTNNEVSFTDTGALGIYSVKRQIQAGNPITQNFVVNLFNPLSSNIKPLDDLGLQGTLASNSNNPVKSNREFWQPIAFAALILLVLEWWLFYRGFQLPKFRLNGRRKSGGGDRLARQSKR